MNPAATRAITRLLAAACFSLTLSASIASADEYPGRPITLVVSNPAGGATDQLARVLADELSKRLKQSIIVSNIAAARERLAPSEFFMPCPTGTRFCWAPPATWS
jgi:tripartite-type tricarboxylate transporter receptor subunit TctC